MGYLQTVVSTLSIIVTLSGVHGGGVGWGVEAMMLRGC